MTGGGRTPLTTTLRRILAAHGESRRTGAPVDEVLERYHHRARVSRRALLGAGAAGAGALALGELVRPAAASPVTAPSIAIVGAGLAGVRAAHWLYRVKGLRSTVYEGNTRSGGRCWTLRGYFPGMPVEHGGAFINTEHTAIRNLAHSLGLDLMTVAGGSYRGWPDRFWIDGAEYPYDAANRDWGEVYDQIRGALRDAPYPQTFDDHTDAGVALDQMTVDEWLAANVPGGLASRFAKLMQSNVLAEYGLDPDQQSALNLVYLLGWNPRSSLDPINGGDEKYSVAGGNDQIVSGMTQELPAGTIQHGHRLVAVRRNGTGTVRLTFQTGGQYRDVTADRVVLALPFTTLRECDLSESGFSPLKRRAIEQASLGANAKVHVQVSARPWVQQGYGGTCYTNQEGFQCGWDDTAALPLPRGVFNFFPAGDQVIGGWTGAPFGPAPADQVSGLLSQVEPIFPGTTAAYVGRAYRDVWWLNPWSRGAYTCPRPGQYTSLFGVEALPEGNVHFAGEHTSTEFYGFLEGAVESGERAAKEVALG